MKFTSILVGSILAASNLPAMAASATYSLAFTGGYSTNTPPYFVEDAPSSGSFTYNPVSGFSNFVVVWGTDSFDLTASANVDPAAEFSLLTAGTNPDNKWGAVEAGGCCNLFNTEFTLQDASASEPNNPSGPVFDGARAIVGTYTTAAVPEPATLLTMSLATFGLLCFSALRLRPRTES